MCCRELRRLRDEGESRFRDRSLLHQRYRMGNLLGKGGFSDVYLVSVVIIFPSPPDASAPCVCVLTAWATCWARAASQASTWWVQIVTGLNASHPLDAARFWPPCVCSTPSRRPVTPCKSPLLPAMAICLH